MERARQAAQKALDLDPELAVAHSAMASVRVHADWDFEGAEQSYIHALDLEPGLVAAHQQYAVLLTYTGRIPAAIEHFETARDLDPLLPDPGGVDLGGLYEMNGEPERALAAWTEREKLAPSYLSTYVRHGTYLCRAGQYDEAIALITRALASETSWSAANLAYCLALAGRRDEAIAKLGELTNLAGMQYVSPVGLALVHMALGDRDAAFAALERGFELRSLRMLGLRSFPSWEPLRGDPRFDDLLRRIGFPES